MDFVEIYTDGSCKGNPGQGGYGALLLFTDASGKMYTKELSDGYAFTTNNRMELLAVISALKALKKPCKVKIYSDSAYVVNGGNIWAFNWQKSDFRGIANADLWKTLLELTDIHDTTFVWLKGHAGNIHNTRADEMAREAAQKAVKTDAGYKTV